MKPGTIQKVQTHNLPITYQMCKAQVMQLARLAMRHSIATSIRTAELRLSQWKGQIGMPPYIARSGCDIGAGPLKATFYGPLSIFS